MIPGQGNGPDAQTVGLLQPFRGAVQQLRPLHRQKGRHLSHLKGRFRLLRRTAVGDSRLIRFHFPGKQSILPLEDFPEGQARKILRLAKKGKELGIAPVLPRPLQIHMIPVAAKAPAQKGALQHGITVAVKHLNLRNTVPPQKAFSQ